MLLQRNPPLARAIPPKTPHSLIISLPTWQDNVNFGKGTIDQALMETTYPRFAIHPLVRSVTKSSFSPLLVAYYRSTFKLAANGISSRLAENCLRRRNGQTEMTLGLPTEPDHEYASYYGSHSPITSVLEAKERIKTRFAGISADGTNIRGVEGLSTSDVYLYSTGMSAIWHVHQMLHDVFGGNFDDRGRTFIAAHVNIIYVDSYRLLEARSSGHRFFTNDTLDDLEHLLDSSASSDTAFLAIFTDFPGNPHLKSADLPRLRMLADKYHIPIIIDETVGCHLNVDVLPYADIVVASLTKVFSGYSNVLGGAMLLNPSSEFYARFKAHLNENYEDNYFDADVLVMELNSRGLEARVARTNENAEALADWLFLRSKVGGMKETVIEEVFYPKYQSKENYEQCMRPRVSDFQPGYGGLVSFSFTSLEAAKTFYDCIQCYKGTTLGTVITLLSPFNALAFPPEKGEWTREHDVKDSLVRFSIGVEDISRILYSVEAGLFAAERSRRLDLGVAS
ncbi:PLP-dependent transferase [Gymnopus androsaceus JB14]|uniref:PLP-dependent transferase n=1 Tax=Gymnopus androsaceus JB14 TaxID=1447944 RepID=A0A6A4HGT8_9AGAR|nr:PLP-dependent transferase [Gymnopus androsaceus JB14]